MIYTENLEQVILNRHTNTIMQTSDNPQWLASAQTVASYSPTTLESLSHGQDATTETL